jgi:hypothetical protein
MNFICESFNTSGYLTFGKTPFDDVFPKGAVEVFADQRKKNIILPIK